MFLKLGRIGESEDSISLFVKISHGSDTCYFKRFPIIVRQPSSKKKLCKHFKNTFEYMLGGERRMHVLGKAQLKISIKGEVR